MMRTYRVESDGELDGTITMDDAGIITYTATAGKEDYMDRLMEEPIPVHGPCNPSVTIRRVPYPGEVGALSTFVTRHGES